MTQHTTAGAAAPNSAHVPPKDLSHLSAEQIRLVAYLEFVHLLIDSPSDADSESKRRVPRW